MPERAKCPGEKVGPARTLYAFSTACGHSSGCKALKTKIMVRTSTELGSTVAGGPALDERSQTSQVQRAGSNDSWPCSLERERGDWTAQCN